MKFLSVLIEDEVQKGEWREIRISKNSCSISHLLFADDILLFGDTNERAILVSQRVLKNFCEASSQSVIIFIEEYPSVSEGQNTKGLGYPYIRFLRDLLGSSNGQLSYLSLLL